MTRKLLVPVSYNGIGLHIPGARAAIFDLNSGAHDTPAHRPITSDRIGRFPHRVREQPSEKVFPLRFVFESCDVEGQYFALSRIFDPTLGPRSLVVRDGDEVTKQVDCIPQQIVNEGEGTQNDREWVVALIAARPLLENTTETTLTASLTSAAAQQLIPRNIGTYFAQPTIEIEPLTLKDPTQAWTLVREVTYCNRSELPLTGPAADAWLIELTGGGWDTASLVDPGGGTSSSTTIAIGQTMPFTITVTSTAGFGATGAKGIMLASPGAGEEQFAYTVLSGTTLSLTARSLGGTAAATHTAAFTVRKSTILKDGRDIAVFIDDVQVPDSQVYINGMDTATTRIWVKISDGPAISAVLAASATAGATTFTLTRADHGFAVGDFIVWNDSGSAKQMALIQAIDRNVLTVLRAVRNTPNANTTNADTRIYRAGRHIQLAYNWALAPARPTLEDSPLIDLNTSSNLLWEWNIAPFWADANRKPGGFRRLLYPGRADVLELIQNRLAFKTSLNTVAGQAAFLDSEPVATSPNFDAIEFASPVGIDDVAGAIEYDAIVDYPFALQIIGRDFLGIEHLVASRLGHESGDSHEPPQTYTNQTEQPGRPLSAVTFRARNILVTGKATGDNNEDLTLGAGAGTDTQDFVLDQVTRIDGVVLRLRRVVNVDANMFLLDASGTDGASGVPVTSAYSHTLSGAGPLEVCYHEVSGYVAVSPGTYHIRAYQASGSAGDIQWMKALRSLFARGAHWEHDGANYIRNADEDMWFYILSQTVDNQEDIVDRTGEAVVLDNIKITFDPDRTMIVDPRPAEDAYYIYTIVERGGDERVEVRYLKRWADNDIVTIDTLDKTIFEGKDTLGLRQTLNAANDEWVLVPTGSNSVTVQAPNGATSEAVRLKFRDTWQ